MLILTRRLNESIVIDRQIQITIIEINGDKVKLGIEAPSDIVILREELYHAICAENINALQPGKFTPAMQDILEASKKLFKKD